MFCWQARRSFAASSDGSPPAGAVGRRLASHLESCASCSREVAELARVSEMVAEAGRIPAPVLKPSESEAFETSVLRAARSREKRPRLEPRSGWLGTASVAAAASLMLVVAMAALLMGAPGAPGAPSMAAAGVAGQSSGLAPVEADPQVGPREVPFTYVEDLVGARRGRIPLTTYVLEPAPDEKPVVRASL